MTPQLKYGIIALFILLDLCVMVSLFSGNPTQPVKQAAAPPPVVTPLPAQQQSPVQQPPPHSSPRPVPPPPPNPYEIETQKCNSIAATYKEKFLNYWPQQLAASLGNEGVSGQVMQQYREYRFKWNQDKRQCPSGWLPPFGSDIEELAIRKDCDMRGTNYGLAFEALSRMSPAERAQFFSIPYYRENGVQTVEAFTRWFQQLKQRCSGELTGGWKPPFDESIISRMTSR
jgi:hypothetical protein